MRLHARFLRPLFALLLFLPAASALAQQLQTFPTGELTIESADGPRKFNVERATTRRSSNRG